MKRDEVIARLMESASDKCSLCGGNRPLVWVPDWKAKHRVCENAKWQSIENKRVYPIYHSCAPLKFKVKVDGKTLFDYANKP